MKLSARDLALAWMLLLFLAYLIPYTMLRETRGLWLLAFWPLLCVLALLVSVIASRRGWGLWECLSG